MLFAGVACGGGQFLLNAVAGRSKPDDAEGSSWFDSKWSPLKKLSDAEYVDMMGEKILRVEADIALIDEHIEKLKELERNGGQGNGPSGESS